MNVDKLFSLNNKTAIITGGSSGIGKAISEAFAERGCAVAIVDIDKDNTSKVVDNIIKNGGNAIGIKCDVGDSDDVKKTVEETVNKFGNIDILVNNAGIGRRSKAEEMTDLDWDSVLAINLKGSFNFCREVGKYLIEQKRSGRIINVASITAIVGVETGNANYAASKGGILAMGRCLAVEWAKHNILVNTLIPTHVRTPLLEELIKKTPDIEKYFINNILLGRMGEVEDIIGPAIFLASDASRFITGQAIIVDGGHTAR